ncbi:unnamed protein product, partial [Cyprideis torosa]
MTPTPIGCNVCQEPFETAELYLKHIQGHGAESLTCRYCQTYKEHAVLMNKHLAECSARPSSEDRNGESDKPVQEEKPAAADASEEEKEEVNGTDAGFADIQIKKEKDAEPGKDVKDLSDKNPMDTSDIKAEDKDNQTKGKDEEGKDEEEDPVETAKEIEVEPGKARDESGEKSSPPQDVVYRFLDERPWKEGVPVERPFFCDICPFSSFK